MVHVQAKIEAYTKNHVQVVYTNAAGSTLAVDNAGTSQWLIYVFVDAGSRPLAGADPRSIDRSLAVIRCRAFDQCADAAVMSAWVSLIQRD